MELNLNNRILFDEVSHSYLLDGQKLLMGVTELMKKHHLSADYGDIPKAILDKAAEEGTAIHREIQAYDAGETFFESPLIENYKRILIENRLKSVYSEYPVSDYELVASAIDKVYEAKGGAVIVDIKCTQKYHRRALEWQTGIYKVFFERLNPDIPVVGCACLWIDKKTKRINGLIPVNPVSESEVNALLEAERNGQIYIDTNATPDLGEVLAPEEANRLAANAEKIAQLEATLKLLKEADATIREKLLDYMTKNNLTEICCPGGSFKVKAGYTTERVDSKKLTADFPAVAARVLKETTVRPSLIYKPNNL